MFSASAFRPDFVASWALGPSPWAEALGPWPGQGGPGALGPEALDTNILPFLRAEERLICHLGARSPSSLNLI